MYSDEQWELIKTLHGFSEAVVSHDLPRAEAIAEEYVRGNVSTVRESREFKKIDRLFEKF